MVEHQPSKLNTWVRFPSPASENIIFYYARVAQLVEHDLAKVGVAGSSPVSRSSLKNGNIEFISVSAFLLSGFLVDTL